MKKILGKIKNRKGFTLIELIVVIAILGILASLAIPRLAGFTGKANDAANTQLLAIIKRSVDTLILTGEIKVSAAGTITVVTDAGAAAAGGNPATNSGQISAYTGSSTITGTNTTTPTNLTAQLNLLVGTDVNNRFRVSDNYVDGRDYVLNVAANGTTTWAP